MFPLRLYTRESEKLLQPAEYDEPVSRMPVSTRERGFAHFIQSYKKLGISSVTLCVIGRPALT